MFTSLVLLTLSSLVGGEQTPLGSPPTVPDNVPVHIRPNPISPLESSLPGFEESGEALDVIDSDSTRNATINLFPASQTSMRPMFRAGCHELEVKTITLAPDVCLSGDYYLKHNFQITEDPICPNGEVPTMLFYDQRSCEGEIQYPFKTGNSEKIPHSCLWSVAPKYWSIIFRCDVWPSTIQGADKHEVAVPPEGRPPLQIPGLSKEMDTPVPGEVESHLFPACNGRRAKGRKPTVVPVDRCLTTPGLAIKITKAAQCANGTRARWARFDDKKCGYGELSPKYGLVDLQDAEIGKCLPTYLPDKEKMGSMAFWCDGVKKSDPTAPENEEPKPKTGEKGSVSESSCMAGKAPFFDHPKTDTCVNMKTDKIKVFSTGTCENGTTAIMATYPEKSCRGTPGFREMGEKDLKTCLDFKDISSFAFWCTGEIVVKPKDLLPGPKPHRSGLKIFAMVVLVASGIAVIMLGAWMAFNTGLVDKIKVSPSDLNFLCSANDFVGDV